MYRTHLFSGALTVALLLAGCTDELTGPSAEHEEALVPSQAAAAVESKAATGSANSDKAAQKGPMIWANNELFRSIVTTATFSGNQGNFDALYVITPYTFAGPYDHLSDSAPGDQDYNGGRWEVFHLKSGVDASKYDDVSSTVDPSFDHDDWESTHFYFECPMLPQRGQ